MAIFDRPKKQKTKKQTLHNHDSATFTMENYIQAEK